MPTRGLTEAEYESIMLEFAPEVSDVIDRCFVTEADSLKMMQNAADEITQLLLGENAPPVITAILAAGTGLTREEAAKLEWLGRLVYLQEIAAKTFPGAHPIEIAARSLKTIMSSAIGTTAALSGTVAKH
jgi:hypothetical protein